MGAILLMFGSGLKDRDTQDGPGPARGAIIIKQGQLHFWNGAGICNHEGLAITHNVAEEQLFTQLWAPILRAEMNTFLGCNGYGRRSISLGKCFAIRMLIIVRITELSTRY